MGAMLWLCAGVCAVAALLAAIRTRSGEPDPRSAADAGESMHVG
ncbi:hypothetical protein [Nocardia kruczakiae]|nr:hypothetical protein [Nocardia kruczakiae]